MAESMVGTWLLLYFLKARTETWLLLLLNYSGSQYNSTHWQAFHCGTSRRTMEEHFVPSALPHAAFVQVCLNF